MKYIKVEHEGLDIYVDMTIPFAFQQLTCNAAFEVISERGMVGEYIVIIRTVDQTEMPSYCNNLPIEHGVDMKIYTKRFFNKVAIKYPNVLENIDIIFAELQEIIAKIMIAPDEFSVQCPYCSDIVEVKVKGKTKLAFTKMPNAMFPVKEERGIKDEYDEKYKCPTCFETFIMRVEL